MKKLIYLIALVLFFSCEKPEKPEPIIERTCWECRFQFISQISEKVYRYCDKTEIGLTDNGQISETEIRQFEQSRNITGVLRVKCTLYKE